MSVTVTECHLTIATSDGRRRTLLLFGSELEISHSLEYATAVTKSAEISKVVGANITIRTTGTPREDGAYTEWTDLPYPPPEEL